jgi:hypothetical protein
MKSEPALTVPFIPCGAIPRLQYGAEGAQRPSSAWRKGSPLLSIGLAILAHGAAAAKPATAKAPSSVLDTRTSTVTVTASRIVPHVQSTFPALDAKVAPGLLVLRVTYDTRMRPEGWSYAREAGADYPDCAAAPRLLDDRRSFVLICRTLPGKRYAVWFNRPPLDDFSSFGRRPATPFELKFATTTDEPVRTLTEAMKADPALSALGNPVEPDGLATYGQSEPPGAP